MANKLEQKAQVEETKLDKPELTDVADVAARSELPEGMGFGEPSTVYAEEIWDQHREKEWPKTVHTFGVRQNQVNRGTAARLRTLEVENRTLQLKVEHLEKELEAAHVREKKIFGRISLELDKIQAEIDRVRLSTKLNSNAVDRILKTRQEEAAASATDPEEQAQQEN